MTVRMIPALLSMAALIGCGAGTVRRTAAPSITPPVTFRGASEAPAGDLKSLADLKWFEVFQDQQLQELIGAALVRNYDVRMAVARVEAAQGNVGVVRANQAPNVGAATDITSLRFSRGGNFPVPQDFEQKRTFGTVAVNLLSFELDIWGRLRRATEAARADMLASEENRKAVVTTLVSDVAGAYFNLLSLDAELEIARRTLKTREDSLKVIQIRSERGLATILDLRQGEQLVQSAAQVIPGIEQRIEQMENQISLLLGQNPAPVPRGKALIDQQQPPQVPAGLPSALLQRRPDIRAAEQNLVAADAMIGIARAAYFPRISLTGFLGSQSDQLTSLFTGPTSVWQFVPQVTQPIFTGGRISSNLKVVEAQQKMTVIQYEKVVQTAFREVSDSLVQHRKTREIRAKQEELVTTLQDRARLSYVRYRGGVDTLLNALDADRDLFEAELGLAQARRNELLALVQLYRALGGGWQA